MHPPSNNDSAVPGPPSTSSSSIPTTTQPTNTLPTTTATASSTALSTVPLDNNSQPTTIPVVSAPPPPAPPVSTTTTTPASADLSASSPQPTSTSTAAKVDEVGGKGLGEDDPQRLLEAVDRYEPLIPTAAVKHFLERAGCNMAEDRLVRVIGLAAQKLAGDIVSDTRRKLYGRNLANPRKRKSKEDEDTRKVLQTVDLAPSLVDQGVSIQKPDFYLHVDNSDA